MLKVIEGIVATAKRNAATPAVITGARAITYGQFLDGLARVSNHLVDRGLPSRSKLFLNIADPDLRSIVFIASIHAGFVPFALLDLAGVEEDAQPDFIVGASALHLPHLAADITIDQSVLSGKLSDGSLRAFPDQPSDALLIVNSTTGSTGRPKLVSGTYGALAAYERQQGAVPGVGYTASVPWPGLRHGERSIIATGDVTGPGIGGVLEALTGGATLIRASRERLETLNLINLFQPCQLTSTPGVLGELIDRMDEHGIACPSVTTIRLVGSLVDEQVLRRIDSHFDARIYVAYGAAEVGIVSGGALDPAAFRRGYVGRLVPAVKLVTSGTQADPAPIVLVRDPETFNCYYVGGKVIPNTETFHMMPDLGYVEGDRLYLAGRDDEVLNISGNKIAFSVIDAELRREPMVKDVAVVSAASLGDPSGVVIGVVTEGEADLPLLRDRVLRVVDAPSAAEHVRLFALHVLPRNPFGKIDRARVIDLYGRST